jgi:hypothetical protein
MDRSVWEIVRQFVREIVLRVDALFSYRTENRIPIRFAANRTAIRIGILIRVDGPLKQQLSNLYEDGTFFHTALIP